RPLGVLRITTSLSQAEEDIRTTRREAVGVAAATLFLILAGLLLTIRQVLVRPLGGIKEAMNRIAEGHLEERIDAPGHDEVSAIATTFNEMARRLRLTYEGLQHERNKLSTIIHSVKEGIVVTNPDGEIVLVNPAAERLLQKPSGQIESEGFFNLLDDPEYLRTYLEREGVEMPSTLVYKGRVLHFHGATFKIDNHAIGSAALIRDITEEKKLKEQLHEIIAKAPFGIVVVDEEGIIRVFNPSSERLFRASSAEMVGQPVLELIPPALQASHLNRFFSYFLRANEPSHSPATLETEAIRRDGSLFPIRLALNRMLLDGRFAIVGMIADITEEKRLLDNLIQSEKMAGLGGMVAGVAHEINTPVGIGVTATSELKERIDLFERLMRSEGVSEEEMEEFLASTRRLTSLTLSNLERAAELVHSFKSVAVDQSCERLRSFRVKEYVTSAITTLHHELKNTRLEIHLECEETLEITSYPGALSRIVINLLGNSRLHAFGEEENGRIDIRIAQEGDSIDFTYRDNGRGMEEETRRRIFEPFFTTRRDRGGSGLGMHIVYNLVTQSLGGRITCESSPGNGAFFRMRFPVLPPQPTPD
ncbi:MAG: PAS domain S-box protein, partial [Magnetococcales bacterium]|nr:PAS domain S-box protein [Magnetococcales bacterium]